MHGNIKPIAWHKESDCMICTSHAADSGGYVSTERNGIRTRISRKILFRRYGEQPRSVITRHTCDRRDCINPNHIIPGSQRDNINDCISRGRNARGEKCVAHKLNENQVREILGLIGLMKVSTIAVIFGVSKGIIYDIKNRKTWKHV